ncbi:hypothetical protein Csa_003882 [Cucumis sativus]|nr:hypothetical protein Csa_003882 [Cucumis sativus]
MEEVAMSPVRELINENASEKGMTEAKCKRTLEDFLGNSMNRTSNNSNTSSYG